MSTDRLFDTIAAELTTHSAVTSGRMFGSTGLKANGKVFAMHVKGALVVKLPVARCNELIDAGTATRFDPGHGRLMKQWVTIANPDTWPDLTQEALTNAIHNP